MVTQFQGFLDFFTTENSTKSWETFIDFIQKMQPICGGKREAQNLINV
jgi:hypothetical protein